MSLNVGDVVQIGKGKVEWTVVTVREVSGLADLLNPLTDAGRTVELNKLTLIRAGKAPETAVDPSNDHRESSYGQAILAGLQSKQIYQGTVPWSEVKARRAANDAAKQSRKANR